VPQKNSRLPERALQPAEKLDSATILAGFVTGHDFSRADKANQINVGLPPLKKFLSAFRLPKAFFRSLFSPAKLRVPESKDDRG
jgi:hypothetical protein